MLNFFREQDAAQEAQKTANENDCPVAVMFDTITKWYYVEEDPDKLEIPSMELIKIMAPVAGSLETCSPCVKGFFFRSFHAKRCKQ